MNAQINILCRFEDQKLIKNTTIDNINIIQNLKHHATYRDKTPERQKTYLTEINDNKEDIILYFRFGYELFVSYGVDKVTYEKVSKFIKTGILPKQTKEVETSVPPTLGNDDFSLTP